MTDIANDKYFLGALCRYFQSTQIVSEIEEELTWFLVDIDLEDYPTDDEVLEILLKIEEHMIKYAMNELDLYYELERMIDVYSAKQ